MMQSSGRAVARLGYMPCVSRTLLPFTKQPIGSGAPSIVIARRAFADGGRRRREAGTNARVDDEHKAKRRDSTSSSGHKPNTGRSSYTGDMLFMMGGSAVAASFGVRSAATANLLRFTAGGPVLAIGAAVSLYEIGGWRLLAAVPASVVAGLAVSNASDTCKERILKEEAGKLIRTGCPSVPEEALAAVLVTPACEYETNKLYLEVIWQEDSADEVEPGTSRLQSWRFVASAVRSSCLHTWVLTSLQADAGDKASLSGNTTSQHLPPQTRYWNANPGPATSWRSVWQWESRGEHQDVATVFALPLK